MNRTFGEIEISGTPSEPLVCLRGWDYTEQQMDRLADDIRSAQCWLRDIRRRQAENETPELPME